MSTISSFRSKGNNHDIYRGKDYMKKFCESLREHTMKTVFKKCKMQKSVVLAKKKIENKYVKDKKYCKVRDHCHYTGEYSGDAHSICNLKYSVPKKIPIAVHNGTNYDYHFIKKY